MDGDSYSTDSRARQTHHRSQSYSFSETPSMPIGPLTFGIGPSYGGVFAPLHQSSGPPMHQSGGHPMHPSSSGGGPSLSRTPPMPSDMRVRQSHVRSQSYSFSQPPPMPMGPLTFGIGPQYGGVFTPLHQSGGGGGGGGGSGLSRTPPMMPMAPPSMPLSFGPDLGAHPRGGGGARPGHQRSHSATEARRMFGVVHERQPFAAQGWLEHAKLEEESGDFAASMALLLQGLAFCPPAANEGLVIRALRCAERLGDMDAARALLGTLQHEPVPRVWRAVLEGANMEARAGNLAVARRIFRFLTRQLPTYGPVFHDAMRAEERAGNLERAVAIAERGLAAVAVPRYGPLWFAALRVFERVSYSAACAVAGRAVDNIWRELQWKVYFELGQVHQRVGCLDDARLALARAALHCPAHLLWKVWLGGARVEAAAHELQRARLLLERAAVEAPSKARATVRIEQARVEEYCGHVDRARAVLAAAMVESRSEKKVFLEAVMLEMRAGDGAAAVRAAWRALQVHRGTGRLWAVLIQLMHVHGEDAQLRVLRAAQEEVPRSGEVWCEGARIFMHPLSRHFNLEAAKRFLEWAVQFTPQYGDSFLELLRLQLLLGATREEEARLEQPNYGTMWFFCRQHALDTPRDILRSARLLLQQELYAVRPLYAQAIAQSQGVPRTVSPGSDADGVCDADFTTGLITLSRLLRRPRTDTERWLFIFGGDVIAP